jgi:hypothetical protein
MWLEYTVLPARVCHIVERFSTLVLASSTRSRIKVRRHQRCIRTKLCLCCNNVQTSSTMSAASHNSITSLVFVQGAEIHLSFDMFHTKNDESGRHLWLIFRMYAVRISDGSSRIFVISPVECSYSTLQQAVFFAARTIFWSWRCHRQKKKS